jgi:ariadne-1
MIGSKRPRRSSEPHLLPLPLYCVRTSGRRSACSNPSLTIQIGSKRNVACWPLVNILGTPAIILTSQPNGECEICMNKDGFKPDKMIGMPCRHEFCETCWHGFICSALDKGPCYICKTCPQVGCNELITKEEVQWVAPNLLSKLECCQLQSFIKMCGMTHWCPGPGCGQAALNCGEGMFTDVSSNAKCNVCNTCFCLKCSKELHAPSITCRYSRYIACFLQIHQQPILPALPF